MMPSHMIGRQLEPRVEARPQVVVLRRYVEPPATNALEVALGPDALAEAEVGVAGDGCQGSSGGAAAAPFAAAGGGSGSGSGSGSESGRGRGGGEGLCAAEGWLWGCDAQEVVWDH